MYHRVAELDCDPWGLAVSPAHFAEHVDVLRRRRSTIPLTHLAQELRQGGTGGRRPIVITFDDGYADNIDRAKPLLEQSGIPATVFLTTGAIGSEREFWWDELERVLLSPGDLSPVLDLRQSRWNYRSELGDAASYGKDAYVRNRLWRAWENPPTARHAIYYELWQRLHRLSHAEKRARLDELLDWAGLKPLMRPSHRLMSLEEARELGRTSLIEVGAHTVTHPALPALDVDVQAEEIRRSKRFLEDMLKRPVNAFAYPHGEHEPPTVSAVREAGFTSACTTAARPVSRQSDPLAWPRFQVLDWSGDEFRARLDAWQDANAHA